MVMTYPPDYGNDRLHDAVNLTKFLELEVRGLTIWQIAAEK